MIVKVFQLLLLLSFTMLHFHCANSTSDVGATQQLPSDLDYSKKETPFSIIYNSHIQQITITDHHFSHIKQKHHFPTNSVMATPDSTSSMTLAKQILLSNDQIDNLKKAVHNGFLKLDNNYGAPDEHRHYLYAIQVNIDGQQKKVNYRSNPSFDEAPFEFKSLEKVLFKLSNDLTRKQK